MTRPIVNGRIKIIPNQNGENNKEQVRIGVNLKASKTLRSSEEWNELLAKSVVNNQEEFPFFINKNKWFTVGHTWFLPTQLFGETKIEIDIQQSALLSTGIQLEVFLRYTTVTKYFPATEVSTAGGKLTIRIRWKAVPDIHQATPALERKNF